jgi:hypothetical protein
MTGSRWSRRTTTTIAQELAQLGIAVSPNTVARLLHDMGYSLRVNQKQISTSSKGRSQYPETTRCKILVEKEVREGIDHMAPECAVTFKL